MGRSISYCWFVIVFSCVASGANADRCSGLDQLMQATKVVAPDPVPWADFWKEDVSDSLPQAGCVPGRAADGLVACLWEFDLGDTRAVNLFNRLDNALTGCLTGRASIDQDKPVNHPDYFAGKSFVTSKLDLRISFKNKGALGLSRVTFRIYETPNAGD